VFESCSHFAINVLAEEQTTLSSRFASPDAEKWQGVEVSFGNTGCPLIAGALAAFECAVEAVHEGGDHRIFIGRVLSLAAAAAGKPLLFSRGAYRQLGAPLGGPATEPPGPGATSALEN